MTRRLISSLTAFAMLVHSILGCCWHHAHATESQSGAAPCTHFEDGSSQSDSKPDSRKQTEHTGCGHEHDESEADHSNDTSSSAAESTDTNSSHEHGPCHHSQCDEGNCQFTKTPVSVTPCPDDGGVQLFVVLPLANLGRIGSNFGFTCLEVTQSPPGSWCAQHCAAPVTQVWRL